MDTFKQYIRIADLHTLTYTQANISNVIISCINLRIHKQDCFLALKLITKIISSKQQAPFKGINEVFT